MYFHWREFLDFLRAGHHSASLARMMGANFASLAREPMGDIRRTANAVYGFLLHPAPAFDRPVYLPSSLTGRDPDF